MSRLLIALIRFYQRCISPHTPAACRFSPTCSQYAIEAIRWHGPFIGFFKAAWRILRCNPWGGHGYDPVIKRISFPLHVPSTSLPPEDARQDDR